jgi:hypothetical protein
LQVLDESEFEVLDISPGDRKKTLIALEELKSRFRRQFQK